PDPQKWPTDHGALPDNGSAEALRAALCQETLDFVRAGLAARGCLICCLQGRSRSVSVLLGFLLLERGVGVDEGLDLVRSSRPQAAPNSLGGRPGGHPRRSWPLKLGFPSGVRVDGVEGSL
ncbi:unnamed protein product, partial [Prorocentrum cordatum]